MDEIWKRDEIDSPCVKLCVLHSVEGICVGCFRTADEIAAWSSMAPEMRKALMETLPERASRLKKRRGGRRNENKRQVSKR